MPHVVLEIPRPLAGKKNLQELLSALHEKIGSLPSVQLSDIKTRIHLIDDFRTAEGTPEAGAFVHARLIQTKPRSLENQKLMSETVLSLLEEFFLNPKPTHPLQLCVETTILPPGSYLKSIYTP